MFNLFSNKKSKKSKRSNNESDDEILSRSPSPTKAEPSTSPPQSPQRSSRRSNTHQASREELPRRPRPETTKSESSTRHSRPPRSKDFRTAAAAAGYPIDRNSHPLNLPPDQLRRLSALSSMSDPTPMDVDSTPSSPAQSTMLGSFAATPNANGATNGTNGQAPAPPPHKSPPTSPAATLTVEDAEAFKTAGNKFYKAKEYGKAIDEYTKGQLASFYQ